MLRVIKQLIKPHIVVFAWMIVSVLSLGQITTFNSHSGWLWLWILSIAILFKKSLILAFDGARGFASGNNPNHIMLSIVLMMIVYLELICLQYVVGKV